MPILSTKRPLSKKSYNNAAADNVGRLKDIMSALTVKDGTKSESILAPKAVGGNVWAHESSTRGRVADSSLTSERQLKQKKPKTFKLV